MDDYESGPFYFCDNYDECGDGWTDGLEDYHYIEDDNTNWKWLCDECYARYIAGTLPEHKARA